MKHLTLMAFLGLLVLLGSVDHTLAKGASAERCATRNFEELKAASKN